MNIDIRIIYKNENNEIETLYQPFSLTEEIKLNQSKIMLDTSPCPHGFHLKATISPVSPIIILQAQIILSYDFHEENRLFLNGYQTWTLSKEHFIHDRMRGTRLVPYLIKKMYAVEQFGDYFFYHYPYKKGYLHGYTYAYVRDGSSLMLLGSINDQNIFTRIEMITPKNQIRLVADCENYHVTDSVTLFDFFILNGEEKDVFTAYFSHFGPKKITEKRNGFTSWYHYYQHIDEKIILHNLSAISQFQNDLFQIDDGYQEYVGDWLHVDQKKFPGGMKKIADAIHQKKMLAGIWLAPFVAEKKSSVFQNHPDWFARDHKNRLIRCGANWSGFYLLDLFNEDVLSYLKNCFHVILDEWGYDFVKLDFLYAAALQPTTSFTHAQLENRACRLLREWVKDKLILGCGVPLASCFNLFDYCRIGCDISLNYQGKKTETWVNQETVSTQRSLLNSIYRRHLNQQVFVNDPDVYLLRSENTNLSSKQKEALTIINMLFGGLYLTSDDVSSYDKKQKDLYCNLRKYQSAKVLTVFTKSADQIEINIELDGKEERLIFDHRRGIFIS